MFNFNLAYDFFPDLIPDFIQSFYVISSIIRDNSVLFLSWNFLVYVLLSKHIKKFSHY